MDIFYEQFITKDYGDIQKKFQSVRNTLVILAMISAVFVGTFGVVTFLMGYVILGLIARNLFLEYEYEITENELVITKIMNKKKRKVITTLNIEKLVNAYSLEEANNKNIRVVNACIEDDKKLKEKILVINRDSKLVGFRVAMDKKLLSICRKLNPMCFNSL
ncbi:aromatic acid exporter family protein [Clostridium chrysemydis]|uniref:aromatic acid exporter family protein n=1 Tax=Clostridium chrysemydis TaxID=2665504 RepID=UPI00188397FA|nr:aromatic acid exporter family protein [Clostridium chrysemydis]